MSPTVRDVLNAVAAEHRVPLAAMLSPNRKRPVAHARFDAMSRLRAMRNHRGDQIYSLPKLGQIFDRDHTTILHGLRKADELFGERPSVLRKHPWAIVQDDEETRL